MEIKIFIYKKEIKPTESSEDSDESLYIILGVVLGLITILIIYLLYLYFSKQKKNENKNNPLEFDEGEVPNEKLVRDSTPSIKEEQNANE